MTISEKAKTTKQFCEELSPSCILDCPLEDKLSQVDCSICEKEEWVLVSVAEQEIDRLNTELCDKDVEILDGMTREENWKKERDRLEGERGLQKQKLKEKAIRLLQIRAGGRYRMFEAGMLYQCLVLLGMQEYTRHKQVDALVKITCHYFHESDAKKQLEELLK